MPNVGLEMRRIKDLSVEEWNILSQKFEFLMLELGYDEKRLMCSNHYEHKTGKTRKDWVEFLRKCKLEDFARLSSKMQEQGNLLGCRWYSMWLEMGFENESLIPCLIEVRLSTGWGSTYEKNGDEKEMMALEKIEMLFLGPFRTYYKCLSPVTRNFRTEAERKESEENGFALAVLMDPGLRRFVFPVA